MFWCIPFGIFYTLNQLTAQVALGLATIAILSYLEIIDSVRDVRSFDVAFSSGTPSVVLDTNALPSAALAPVTFAELTPLALLALHTFYATGHQSTISSIQWKSAFVLTSTLRRPLSPLSVVLNTFGPQALVALAGPLLALWNTPPLPHPAAAAHARREAVRAALGLMLYHATLLLGSAASAAWLRRHLMVWKIFAPRFMNAAATLLAVDLALLIGVGVGVRRVVDRVGLLFVGMAGAGPSKKTQ